MPGNVWLILSLRRYCNDGNTVRHRRREVRKAKSRERMYDRFCAHRRARGDRHRGLSKSVGLRWNKQAASRDGFAKENEQCVPMIFVPVTMWRTIAKHEAGYPAEPPAVLASARSSLSA